MVVLFLRNTTNIIYFKLNYKDNKKYFIQLTKIQFSYSITLNICINILN